MGLQGDSPLSYPLLQNYIFEYIYTSKLKLSHNHVLTSHLKVKIRVTLVKPTKQLFL